MDDLDDLTPEELQDVCDRVLAIQMKMTAADLNLGASMLTASVGARRLARALRASESAEFDHLRAESDLLEVEVAASSWYPEADRG